jgi:uncharacterized protein YkwD
MAIRLRPSPESRSRIVPLAVVLALLVPASGVALDAAAPAAAYAAVSTAERDAAVQRILADTNAARAAAGLPALTLDPQMSSVAQTWTDSLASTRTLSHNPQYSTLIPAGWTSAAENVAYGYTPSTVTTGWMGSAGHRANILGDFTDIGIGYQVDSAGRGWYTQDFARYTVKSFTLTRVPVILGIARVGQVLTGEPGSWKPDTVTRAYQWRRDGTPIAGATTKTYLTTAADAGHALTVSVTGSRPGYRSATTLSAPVTIRP